MKYLLTFLLSILWGSMLYAQYNAIQKDLPLDSLIKMAENFKAQNDLTSSNAYRLAAVEKAKMLYSTQDSTYISCLSALGLSYSNIGEYKNAIQPLKKSAALWKELKGINSKEYLNDLINLASPYSSLGRYTDAEELYLFVKETLEKSPSIDSVLYADVLDNFAHLYWLMGVFDQAEPLFVAAKSIRKQHLGENHPDYIISISNLSSVYKAVGRFEESEALLLEARDLRKKIIGENHMSYANTLNNLAHLYWKTGRPEMAEALILETKSIVEKNVGKKHLKYALSLSGLASIYRSLNRFEEAETAFKESIDILGEVIGSSHPNYASALDGLAVLYKSTNRFEEAEKLYLQALAIRAKTLGKQSSNYISSLNNLSSFYQKTNDLAKSKTYALAAINANIEAPDSLTEQGLTKISSFHYRHEHLIMSLLEQLLALYQLQYQQDKKPEQLQQYYIVSKAAITLGGQIRVGFSEESSKLRILRESSSFVEKSIHTAIEIGKETNLSEAFGFAEQNKSILLADMIRGQKAQILTDLPDSLIAKEQDLQKRKDLLQKEASLQKDEDSKLKYNRSLNSLKQEIDAFLKSLEQDYPRYHRLKYQAHQTQVKELQGQLTEGLLFLEYFVGNDKTYLFAITKDNYQVISIDIRKDSLSKKIKKMRTALTDYSNIKHQETVDSNYTATAFWFFQNFIQPSLTKQSTAIKKMVIVADGELGHLPFEAFLTAPAKANSNYQNLDYLLKDYSISYNYAASLWKEQLAIDRKNNNGKMLAAAAAYVQTDSSAGKQQTRSPYLRSLRKVLSDLPEAKEEVHKLSEYFVGTFLQGRASNEAAFKEKASNYAIIHLAMHGLFNERSPILSSLAFTENGDSIEDNFLEAWEIAHLKLNADLVVLSACETGFGKFEQGEGIMSLARSFMYAGVPSLVVSLWQVNDGSTSFIMQSFYQNLAKGLDKAKALQQAKLEYIKMAGGGRDEGSFASTTTIAAHPAFWAPFIQLGDSRPINIAKKGNSQWIWWTVASTGLLVLLIGGAWLYKSRKRKAS